MALEVPATPASPAPAEPLAAPTPAPAPVGDGRTAEALVHDVADLRGRVTRLERREGEEESIVPGTNAAPEDEVDEQDDAEESEAETPPPATGDPMASMLEGMFGLDGKGPDEATDR